jgi:hypothetical protein
MIPGSPPVIVTGPPSWQLESKNLNK